MKRKIKKLLRRNRNELKWEIQRVRDKMQELEPGTKEYKDALDCYKDLLDREKELKRLDKDLDKVIVAGGLGIVGIIFYRLLIDKTGDPFFRDIAKSMLKVVHV